MHTPPQSDATTTIGVTRLYELLEIERQHTILKRAARAMIASPDPREEEWNRLIRAVDKGEE